MRYFSFIFLFLAGCSNALNPLSSVIVMKISKNAGGSGTIMTSSETESTILTNRHVCELISKEGGLVKTSDSKTYLITSFKPSNIHDLCLVKVAADLKYKTEIAKKSPDLFSKIFVVGHPHLIHTIISSGDLLVTRQYPFVVGSRPCTRKEIIDPKLKNFCGIIGSLPIIRKYKVVFLSTIVMPGSSGSGVFDSEGNLVAVVFAEMGEDFGYAIAVPYSHVVNFMEKEINNIPEIFLINKRTGEDSSSNKSMLKDDPRVTTNKDKQ